jgi:co-chaperonin GroES (HSP10)
MRPLNAYVFVKELQNNGDVTPAGIKLPDTLNLPYEIGAVIAVGEGIPLPDGTLRPHVVKPGNLVAYHANSGVPFQVMFEAGRESCRFLLGDNIFAVLEENCIEEIPEEGEKH